MQQFISLKIPGIVVFGIFGLNANSIDYIIIYLQQSCRRKQFDYKIANRDVIDLNRTYSYYVYSEPK